MFTTYIQAGSTLKAMFVTGLIFVPVVMATPAVQDLVKLRTVIKEAADIIGDMNNPSRGWGVPGNTGQMGTADLIRNITNTILDTKFQVDTNKTMWLDPTNSVNTTDPALNTTLASQWTLTLPLNSSIVLPSTLPTSTPSPSDVTMDLSTPYIDYVSALSDLCWSLTLLGRAWHREMNAPVSDAIGELQKSMTTMQTTMLENELIDSSAVMRTIRASSSLESTQQAWSRSLNLPGGSGSGYMSDNGTPAQMKRSSPRPPPANGRHYSHMELWGRKEQSNANEPSPSDTLVEWHEQAKELERGRAQPFEA